MSTCAYGDSLPGVHLAVWVLVQDGLRVPPFDVHPDGDHSLRDAGLQAEDWRTWVHAMVAAAENARKCLTALSRSSAGDPLETWAGPSTVAVALDRMWKRYQPLFWESTAELLDEHRRMIAASTHEPWWSSLPEPESCEAYWTFYSVAYPRIVWYPITPSSLIISDLGHRLSFAQYGDVILKAHLLMKDQGGAVS